MSTIKKKNGRKPKSSDAPHPSDILAGQRLRSVRIAKGLTQMAVGDAVGVTFQQVQKYERGTNRISVSMLGKLAAYLSVPVEHFFAPSAPLDTIGSDRRTLEFAKLFQEVAPRHHALLRNLMTTLSDNEKQPMSRLP